MKKKVIIAVLLCVLVGAVVAIFVFVKNDSEKSAGSSENKSSSEPITNAVEIKSLIDKCIEENGYKIGVRVEIQDSGNWNIDGPNHDIVIVRTFMDHSHRSEIETWGEYMSEIHEKVYECISENNIDSNYVLVGSEE